VTLTVLSVAYPFAPVGPDATGGAEQVLAAIDAALTQAGHRSVVVAREDSTVQGTLLPIPRARGTVDTAAYHAAHESVRRAIRGALERWPVDLVHLHGVDFYRYLPPPGVAALATLHLPPEWYPAEIFHPARARTFLVCVSPSQRRRCPASPVLLPEIRNGVPVERFGGGFRKRDFAAALGRVCPEKGFHLALAACRRADSALLLAGRVFMYPEHRAYFAAEILPRLDARRRFLGPLGFRQKRRLLASARCLLVPSLVPETSSLVAMESLASGTPVVAFRAGALPELIADGSTGFLVADEREMADALGAVRRIDPEVCLAAARERFSAATMAASYLDLFGRIVRERAA
jgi:glycosyltransferase involved in cell wall biosynthesis